MIKDLTDVQRQSYQDSELVFIGEPIRVNSDGSYELKVIEVLKGTLDQFRILGQANTSCSLTPELNDGLWIIYTNINSDGLIDIMDCGLSRSYSFPFIYNEQTSPPPPPDIYADDQAIHMIEHEQRIAEHLNKALNVLKAEIEQLRKWRDG